MLSRRVVLLPDMNALAAALVCFSAGGSAGGSAGELGPATSALGSHFRADPPGVWVLVRPRCETRALGGLVETCGNVFIPAIAIFHDEGERFALFTPPPHFSPAGDRGAYHGRPRGDV